MMWFLFQGRIHSQLLSEANMLCLYIYLFIHALIYKSFYWEHLLCQALYQALGKQQWIRLCPCPHGAQTEVNVMGKQAPTSILVDLQVKRDQQVSKWTKWYIHRYRIECTIEYCHHEILLSNKKELDYWYTHMDMKEARYKTKCCMIPLI